MIPSDRVLKHQYCAKNYQCYSELIQDLLQAEKHDELHCLRSIIVQRVKKRWMKTNHQRMLINSRKAKETNTRRTNPKTKVQGKERNPSNTTVVVVLIIFQRSAKCNIPQHLVDLYQKSHKEDEKAKGSYEAHFNTASDEATILGKRRDEAAKPSLIVKDYIDRENMTIEYISNDMFRDQDLAPFIFIDFN
jgi:hypothetical protein